MDSSKLFGSLIVSMMILANILATKITVIPYLNISVTAGVIPVAIMFLCSDILCERHGQTVAREWVHTGLAVLILSWLLIYAAVEIPPAASWDGQAAFAKVLTASFPIVTASFLTFLISQLLDIRLFHIIREFTGEKQKWVRNVGSTVISQFADTVIFTMLAFLILPPIFGSQTLPAFVLVQIIGAEYVVKLAVAIIDTPAFYALTHESSA